VVGGADTGCQLASILADFGVEVTLVEAGPKLVPVADQDVSEMLAQAFASRGIGVLTSTLVQGLERTATGITAHHLSGGHEERLEVDTVFLAVGWPSNADTINAVEVGIAIDRGYITVDESLRTSLPHVFAAGDVNGLSMLVPSARLEGRVAAENAVLGTRRRFAHELVPTGSFTDPEYGAVGLTEAQAREGYDCEVGIARYEDLVRPVVDDRTVGFCKLIVERHRRYVLGAHVLGEYSAEVVQTAAACMAANLRIEQIADLEPAFPTFTEGINIAAQMIVRQMGIAPSAPTWGELRAAGLIPRT
jgi:pyruvate/2-oxoglutarate dehydrogenase complex dihydrolipoamide dehydrogenase (E3) component